MTSEELGEVLHLKESYIRNHWTRIVKTYKKRSIFLYKVGRGDEANYGIKLPWEPEVIFDVDALEMIYE